MFGKAQFSAVDDQVILYEFMLPPKETFWLYIGWFPPYTVFDFVFGPWCTIFVGEFAMPSAAAGALEGAGRVNQYHPRTCEMGTVR